MNCDYDRKAEVYTPRRSWMSNFPVLEHLRRIYTTPTENQPQIQAPEPFERYSLALTDMLATFSRVKEYEVHWGSSGNFHSVLHVMAHIWTSLGSNLSTLKWKSSFEKFNSILLESPSVHFPVLRDLSLRLHLPASESHGDNSAPFYNPLASFMNRHCPTIRSLSFLTVDPGLLPIDITSLLPMVGHFPNLEKLYLHFGVEYNGYVQISTPAVLARFLSNHDGTLQHLAASFVTIDLQDVRYFHQVDDAIETMFPASLDHLITLEVSSHVCLGKVEVLKSAIRQITGRFSDTLTTLTLDTSCGYAGLTFEEAKSLIAVFAHRPADTGLKTLVLSVDVLCPQLVDLLALSLPGLVELTLKIQVIWADEIGAADSQAQGRFHFCLRRPSPPYNAVYSLDYFRTEMRKRVYPNWALRHIDVQQALKYHTVTPSFLIAECIPDARHFELAGSPYYVTRRADGATSWHRI